MGTLAFLFYAVHLPRLQDSELDVFKPLFRMFNI